MEEKQMQIGMYRVFCTDETSSTRDSHEATMRYEVNLKYSEAVVFSIYV
jgi:hypothetical protein